MCKYKTLKKPNLKTILLFLEKQKVETQKEKFIVAEISSGLDIDRSHVLKYLRELEKQEFVTLIKYGNMIEVLLL